MYQLPDRFAVLKDVLKRPLKGDSGAITLLREIGYGVLYLADDLLSLRDVRESLMRIEKSSLEFQKEALEYRAMKIERERNSRPQEEIERELNTTQDLINKLEERNRRMLRTNSATREINTLPLATEQPPAKEKHWLIKFMETFAPFAAGAIGLELLKALLKLAYGGSP